MGFIDRFFGGNDDGGSYIRRQPLMYRCPRCGSSDIYSRKKGFSVGNAFLGSALFGRNGILFGLYNSERQKHTCQYCGYEWIDGD